MFTRVLNEIIKRVGKKVGRKYKTSVVSVFNLSSDHIIHKRLQLCNDNVRNFPGFPKVINYYLSNQLNLHPNANTSGVDYIPLN